MTIRGTLACVAVPALVLILQAASGESFAQGAGMRQPPAAAITPPFNLGDPTAVAEGGRLFQQSCPGYCHGREGRVARAPRLRGRADLAPRYLLRADRERLSPDAGLPDDLSSGTDLEAGRVYNVAA